MITGTPVAVAAPGTPVALLAASKVVRKLIIQAYKATGVANAGNVCVGDAAALIASKPGVILAPGASLVLDVDGYPQDLATIYVDAVLAADGVCFSYIPY
jgi:hypothetical protein